MIKKSIIDKELKKLTDKDSFIYFELNKGEYQIAVKADTAGILTFLIDLVERLNKELGVDPNIIIKGLDEYFKSKNPFPEF